MDIETIAADLLAALDSGDSVAPLTDRLPGFDIAAAYRVTAAHRRLSTARGECGSWHMHDSPRAAPDWRDSPARPLGGRLVARQMQK